MKTKRKKRLPISRLWGLIGIMIFVVGLTRFITGMTTINEEVKEKKSAEGINVCAYCHEDRVKSFKNSLHFAGKAICTDCHSNAAKHIDTGEKGTILAFNDKNTLLQDVKRCITCHKGTCVQYMSGPHGQASMACTNCHSIHKANHKQALLPIPIVQLCAGCHPEIMAQFNLNERHRLIEGILECTTCHDPHKPATRERLGGIKREECLKCHRDKGGPFIYEHKAPIIEGCTICHDVHGSVNRHMLKYQTVANLCLSCHSAVPSFHRGFQIANTNCATCHSSIHGSNLDPRFLK